jgi:thiol-disulfide isomerase/thioredoxin
MRRSVAVTLTIIGGALVGSALVVGLSHQGDVAAPGAVPTIPAEKDGRPAPPLAGPRLVGGGTVDLASYAGKTVVVNFWASWCIPCRAEAPELVAFSAAHPGVQMVSVDVADSLPDARAFAAHAGWRWPIMVGSDVTAQTWLATALPKTVVISPAGNVVWRKTGGTTRAELASLVKPA